MKAIVVPTLRLLDDQISHDTLRLRARARHPGLHMTRAPLRLPRAGVSPPVQAEVVCRVLQFISEDLTQFDAPGGE